MTAAAERAGLVRASVAVVGVAESDLGQVTPGMSPVDLMAQATARALEDSGLVLGDIDGIFCASAQTRFGPMVLAEYLGIQPRYFDGTQIGGSSFMSHLAHAQLAIQAGLCDTALIAYGSTQRSVSRSAASPPDVNPYETPFRPMMPASAYALAASRHMHEFGTTREQLAEVAVAARQWALMNPAAWEKKPLTIPDVLASRMVSWPLTVRDCCLVVDGGGAMLVASAARARTLRREPVYVLGVGESLGHSSISNMRDLTVTPARESGRLAFARAGLRPADVKMLSLYDAFTITPILFLEDLGFCPKGEGGRFVQDGAIAPGGRLAVNTNGGGLSYCHPGMYGLLAMIEAVRQVRGECGARQIPACDISLAHGNGGVLSSQCTVLFGNSGSVRPRNRATQFKGNAMASTMFDSELFRDMFGTKEMREVFSDRGYLACCLEVEAALARAQASIGMIPAEAAREITRKGEIGCLDFDRLRQECEVVGYPILGLVKQLAEACDGDAGGYVHWGATTQDIMDTAVVLQVRRGLDLVETDLRGCADLLRELAVRHRDVPMAGRTHLQHALPVTFGFKTAVWRDPLVRHLQRLEQLRPRVLTGQFGGAAGTLASLGKDGLIARAALMKELGLREPDITWHVSRDSLAEAVLFTGLVTGSLAKIGTDMMLMMATEFGEAFEPYQHGRGASSTMPQKRNPISSELIVASAKVVRQNCALMLDASVHDFERATGPWHAEWVAIP